jgi:hypothetical protein
MVDLGAAPSPPSRPATPVGPPRRSLVVRRVRLLSVVKLAVLIWAWAGLMLALAVLAGWGALRSSGNVGRFEDLMRDLGFNDFAINGGEVTRVALTVVGVSVAVGALGTVLVAAMFNLLAGAVGGLEVVVDEVDRRPGRLPRRRRHSRTADAGAGSPTRISPASAPRSWTGRTAESPPASPPRRNGARPPTGS